MDQLLLIVLIFRSPNNPYLHPNNHKSLIIYWLVVYLPLCKMMEFVNGKDYPINFIHSILWNNSIFNSILNHQFNSILNHQYIKRI